MTPSGSDSDSDSDSDSEARLDVGSHRALLVKSNASVPCVPVAGAAAWALVNGDNAEPYYVNVETKERCSASGAWQRREPGNGRIYWYNTVRALAI